MRALRKLRAPAAALLAAGTLLWSLSAAAETVGIIYPEISSEYDDAIAVLKNRLAAEGIRADKGEIFIQRPALNEMSLTNSFRKFAQRDVDLIIIFGDHLIDVACGQRTKVPVLFGFGYDPLRASCIRKTEAPGRNVTGVKNSPPLFTLFKKTGSVRPFETLGVFVLEGDVVSEAVRDEIDKVAGELNFTVVPIPLSGREGLEEALGAAPSVDLIFYPNFPLAAGELDKLHRIATQRRVPCVSIQHPTQGAPVLLALYYNPEDQGRVMSEMAVEVLNGFSPGKMPLRSPKKVELEFNVSLAKKLGVKVSMDILDAATRITK